MINKNYNKNGYLVKKFSNTKLIENIEKIVKRHFYRSTDYYSKMSLKNFHKITLNCQNQLNKINIQKFFRESEKKFLEKEFGEELLFSSFVTLRAVRPVKNDQDLNEPLDWHRETFYGKKKHIKYAINFWMPVLNYSKKIGLSVIPESHKIPDKKIIRDYIKNTHNVRKFSPSHKLGFPYAPKKLISGVNFDKAKKVILPKKNFMIFSQYLIHGNGQNFSKKIRFAVNFSFVPSSKVFENKIINSKKYNYQKSKTNSLYISV